MSILLIWDMKDCRLWDCENIGGQTIKSGNTGNKRILEVVGSRSFLVGIAGLTSGRIKLVSSSEQICGRGGRRESYREQQVDVFTNSVSKKRTGSFISILNVLDAVQNAEGRRGTCPPKLRAEF